MTRRARRRQGGFSLPEVLAAVVIIAILSVIAIPAYRSLVSSAAKAEPARVLHAIRTAEEAYKGAQTRYGQPSGALATLLSCANCYPMVAPTKTKVGWGAACTTCGRPAGMPDWPELDVKVEGPVMYGYTVVTGLPGVAPPAVTLRLAGGAQAMVWPTRPGWETTDWYAMMARGDVSGEGTPCLVLGNSFNTQLAFEVECQ